MDKTNGKGKAKVVHVVGTGTIGEPLIGLLTSLREPLGIDEVTFYKHTPRPEDRPMLKSLIRRGARVAVDPDKTKAFRELGIVPELTAEEALGRAWVVVDCSPAGIGLKNKATYLRYTHKVYGFVAQGSEFGFGKPYARGINDGTLRAVKDQFLQVVSCNTHNIAVLVKAIALESGGPENLLEGKFLCLRRASDISQAGGFIPGPEVKAHSDPRFGTHHARDAYHLFEALGMKLNLFSSEVKLNTQYMHCLWFALKLKKTVTNEVVIERLRRHAGVAFTAKESSHLIFSFGRDHGFYGRILNQTVVVLPTLHVRDGSEVIGFCFTPQDGNSLLSSIAAVEWFLYYPGSWEARLKCLEPLLFEEV